MSSPLRRPLSYFDRNRLGPKDDIAEHMGLQCVQGIADREPWIPPIASEGVVHGCDLPSLLLGVRCDDGYLAAGPAKIVVRSRREGNSVRGSRTSTARSGTISSFSSSAAISQRFSAGAW